MSSPCSPIFADFCLVSAIFGKKLRNNPVMWYKNVRSWGRAAVIVSVAGYLILQERWVKGRAGTAPVWHLEEALSYRVRICMSPVNPRGTRSGLHALNEDFATRAIKMSPPCLQCGHLCVTRGKAALSACWWLQLECMWVMGPQQHTACCNLKNNSEIQWELVQMTWIKLPLGYPIHSHLSIVAFPSLK